MLFAHKKKHEKREEKDERDRDPTWERKSLSIQLRCRVTAWEALVLRLRQRAYRQLSATELNLEKSDLFQVTSQTRSSLRTSR